MMRIGSTMGFTLGDTLLLINIIGIDGQVVLNLDLPHRKKVKFFLTQLTGYLVFTTLGKR